MNKEKLILLVIFLSTICFGQTNYYVTTSGSNTNNGSLASPWQTIQYSLNQMPQNSILNILSGTYYEKIIIPVNNITLKNYSGTMPIIDGLGITSQNAILEINNKSNIIIDGIELQNNIQNGAQGILISGSGNNIIIKNCKIHDIHFSSNVNALVNASTNAQGIIVYGSDVTTPITNLKIQNNELYNCRLGYSEGIAVNGNIDGFEVTNNNVHNLTNIGIDLIGHEGTCPTPANDQARNGLVKRNIVNNCISPYATSGGIYVDGGRIIIIEDNTSYYNGYGIEIGCENIGKTTDAITVRNNIIYDNQICGVALGGFAYPLGSGKVVNSSIRNNTLYFNDYSNSRNGEMNLSYSENCTIENNIFYTTPQNILLNADLTQPTLSFNYNNVYCQAGNSSLNVSWNGTNYTGFTAFSTGSSTNSNSVFGDPLFTSANINNPDFHISTNSPSKNAGNPSYVPGITETDFYNELRIEGGRIDCGADEFGTTLGTQITEKKLFNIYPNPTSNFINIDSEILGNKYQIFNINGQKLLEGTTDERINITQLNNGIYLLKLENENINCIYKIIKQ